MKNKHTVLIWVVLSLLIPTGVSVLLEQLGSNINPILAFGVLLVACVVVALAVDFIIKALKSGKTHDAVNVLKTIKTVGEKFCIPVDCKVDADHLNAMFYFPSEELELASQIELKKYKPVIYYSLSVKTYLNWIDYVFFRYLGELKKALKCEIIIAVHHNDQHRLVRADRKDSVAKYEEECRRFKAWIKIIIGEDTVIKDEQDFYKENPTDYAVNFRSFYVSKINEYACKIGVDTNVKGDTFAYNDFKRTLSYVESTFPIKQISSKHRRSKKLFVLDRVTSQEIWKDAHLNDIKKNNKMIFIAARTLTYEDGLTPINVHKKENVPNFTDTVETISNKIRGNETYPAIDLYTQRMMYSLINSGKQDEYGKLTIPGDADITSDLIRSFENIKKEISQKETEMLKD